MVLFHPLLAALCRESVDFVVIGGLAAIAQGATLVTWDLDVCHSRSDENLKKVAAALAPLSPRLRGVPPELPFVLDVAMLRSCTILTLTTDAGDLDLVGEVSGLGSYSAVLQYSDALEIEGLACRVLNLEGLILAKKAAGRKKDLAALPELEALRQWWKDESK